MWELTDIEKNELLRKSKFSFVRVLAVKDENYIAEWIDKPFYSRKKLTDSDVTAELICHCKPSNNIPQKVYKIDHVNEVSCPYCNNSAGIVWPKDFKKSAVTSSKYFYVKCIEDAFLIYNYEIRTIYNKDKSIDEEIKINAIVHFKIGEGVTGYKIVRGNSVKTDAFDILQINSQTVKFDVPVFYENSDGLIDFLLKHKSISNKTGFIEFMNLTNVNIAKNISFFLYLYLLTQYPAIELLIKMKYVKLVSNIFSNVANQPNRAEIKAAAYDFDNLIMRTTKGSLALAMPKFAADYLNDIDAGLYEYKDFSVLFSYQTFTRESFFNLLIDHDYRELSSRKRSLFENLKYGYTIEKEISYLKKQSEKFGHPIDVLLCELLDYNRMAELLGVPTGDYPSNIRKAHENLVSAYNIKKNEMYSKMIDCIATECEKYIPEDENYTIILPHTTEDFIREGQDQHNCVASYAYEVRNQKCIVFFIRKKTDPENSYITAEFRHDRLYQIFYRYNNKVHDTNELDYAKKFCNMLSKNKYKIMGNVLSAT